MPRRTQAGIIFPSPVVILTIIAVAMAGVAFFATRNPEPTEREVTTVATTRTPSPSATPTAPVKPTKPAKPRLNKGKVFVEVYNNSGITGLAGDVADRVTAAGWQVVGSDNWYGTIPATTVYYPKKLEAAAKALALDLGIRRIAPAVDPMKLDRLTVILTAPLD